MSDKKETKEEAETRAARAMLKAVYDDKEIGLNGRSYMLTNTTHSIRLKVFAFYSQHQKEITEKNFSFLGTDEWVKIERLIFGVVTFEDVALNKSDGHFENEEFEKDYLTFIITAMAVISYPFL